MAMFGVLQQWHTARVRRDHQIFMQLLHQFFITFCLAFWPPALLSAMGAPIDTRAFFTWWAFLWLFLASAGFLIVALFRCYGFRLGSALHSLFLLLNFVSSPALVAPELTDPFFRIGLGLPLNSAVQGSRTLVFGSYNVLGRCIGVLTAWAVTALLMLFVHIFREYAANLKVLATKVSTTELTLLHGNINQRRSTTDFCTDTTGADAAGSEKILSCASASCLVEEFGNSSEPDDSEHVAPVKTPAHCSAPGGEPGVNHTKPPSQLGTCLTGEEIPSFVEA